MDNKFINDFKKDEDLQLVYNLYFKGKSSKNVVYNNIRKKYPKKDIEDIKKYCNEKIESIKKYTDNGSYKYRVELEDILKKKNESVSSSNNIDDLYESIMSKIKPIIKKELFEMSDGLLDRAAEKAESYGEHARADKFRQYKYSTERPDYKKWYIKTRNELNMIFSDVDDILDGLGIKIIYENNFDFSDYPDIIIFSPDFNNSDSIDNIIISVNFPYLYKTIKTGGTEYNTHDILEYSVLYIIGKYIIDMFNYFYDNDREFSEFADNNNYGQIYDSDSDDICKDFANKYINGTEEDSVLYDFIEKNINENN
jgi:hypothetical protein